MAALAARKTIAPSSKRFSHFSQSGVPGFGPGSDVTRTFAAGMVETDGLKASNTAERSLALASSCVKLLASSHQIIGLVHPCTSATRGGSVMTSTPDFVRSFQSFSFFGFLIGLWADGWEKLQIAPMLIVTPLTFLGGSFYSISMLPPVWQKVALFNPVVYLVSAFRWSFYSVSDVNVVVSFGMTVVFLVLCMLVVRWIFRTGYNIKA